MAKRTRGRAAPKGKEKGSKKKSGLIVRKDLLNVLRSLKPGISDNNLVEHSDHFVFKDGKVISYNDNISIQRDFETDLSGAVKADEFYNLIDKLKTDEIDIVNDVSQFNITSGNTEASINIDEFPSIPFINPHKFDDWKNLPKDFSEVIGFSLFSIGRDLSRPILSNVFVNGRRVYSSDRYRVTRGEMKSGVKSSFLLPGSAAKHLINYDPVSYCIDESWIHFCNEDKVYFSCKSFSGEYPKLDHFLDIDGVSVDLPPDLKETIDRVKIFVESEFEQDLKISLNFKKNELICLGEGKLGKIKEAIKIKYLGKVFTIKIHPVFLKDILSVGTSMTVSDNSVLFEGSNFKHIISLLA